MEPDLKELVRRRAGNACEYCCLRQDATPLISFHIDHIVSRQHGGSDEAGTLALVCDRCNAYKGPNLTSIDPDSNAIVPLFNPRQDIWADHFAIRGGRIIEAIMGQRRSLSTARLLCSPRSLSLQWLPVWPVPPTVTGPFIRHPFQCPRHEKPRHRKRNR